MKNLSKSILIAICSAALLSTTAHAQVLAAWTFENDSIAVNNSPAASTGMATYATPNVGVTTDDVLVGKGSDTGANTVADTTNTWRVRGQAGSNGAANGWSSLAPIGTQGAVFAVPTTTATSGSINVSFDWYATTQGEANLQLEYTTNGTTWTNVPLTLGGSDSGLSVLTGSASDTNTTQGSYVSDNLLNNSVAGQDWFTGLKATITNPAALNDPNFAIELVNASTGADDISTQGTALNNNSGNWRFDNVSVTAVAAPEPSTYALMIGGLALLIGVRVLRRSKNSVQA